MDPCTGNEAVAELNSIVKEEPMEQPPPSKQQAQGPAAYAMSTDSNNTEEYDEAECTTEHGQDFEIKNNMSKCALCGKSLVPDDNAKLLECLHAACTSCINAKLSDQHGTSVDAEVLPDERIIMCESCNVVSQPENLIENRFFSKFLEDDASNTGEDDPKDAEEEKKCTNCSENAIATSWCVECEELICQNCVMAHQRLKITKDHTIKPKEEIANDGESGKKGEKKLPVYLFCTLHPHEQLSLFCQTCDRLTCRDCQLTEHRDHKYKFIVEIASETRQSVKNLLNEVSYKRELLKSAMKVIEDRQILISDKKTSLVQDITQMVMQLTNAVSSRGKQLILRLNEVCEQKQSTLNEKKVALDQLSKLTDHCIDFVNYALDKGTDMELLYSKKSVTNHLQRIKSKRADIPNPEIPVRIHLSMDKLTDLVKVISSIGAIVVDGRVYPSNTPPSTEPSAPTTPISEPVEQKQTNSCSVSIVMEGAPASQAISLLTNQPAANILPNAYMQPMNIPNTSHQQIAMQSQQHMANQQQMQAQTQNFIHYNAHNMQQRASPQGQQRMQTFNFNGRMQPQQQPMMMAQRPGLGHQQVTSSTHPHQQQMHVAVPPDPHLNQNASLRGLLAHNPPAYRPATNTVPYRFPPRYRYPNPGQRPIAPQQTYQASTSLLTGIQMRQPNQQSMINMYQHPQIQPQHQLQQQQSLQPQGQAAMQQSARPWHIPQNMSAQIPASYPAKNPVQQDMPAAASGNATYKITLKNQPAVSIAAQTKSNSNTASPPVSNDTAAVVTQTSQTPTTQAVSSSMSKTPSPAPHPTDESQKSLEKFCQKSLNDLMLTIAKLDSNGIMVIPETQKNQLDSAQVDSSTDEGANAMTDNSSATSMTNNDPNEDWCAVCMDGGDAVLCCDKCPKVFHLYCHIPNLKSFPEESETWQCMLCTNVLDCSEDPVGEKRPNRMSTRDLRIAQRIVLELYCQYEQSLPFREVVPPEIVEYHRVIKKPIALDVIKEKLKPESENHYTDLKQVIADIRLMFKNAYTFNPPESQVFHEAKSLDYFFEKLLTKWAENYASNDAHLSAEGEEDEEVFPPNRKYRRIIND
ncbi:E3 ubiquitin-protein ligase TRIM33 [Nasonia vitripennis]|uniref:E3 ubiquitin-protein ligase TRIM33 n=1 Tax=Nasonia vitripennis TaxID=7425 RepID=A0A7M7LMA9_NASVI|nr:E3 ubiquitin-protein ligase TRIM33 [Nasonia vitripennis]